MRFALAVVIGVVAAGGLTACGGDSGEPSPGESASAASPVGPVASSAAPADPEAQQLYDDARAAAEAATTVQVTGTVPTGKRVSQLDFTLTDAGAQGTMGRGDSATQLILTPDTIYVKGSKAFNLQFAGKEASKVLEGKWLEVPTSDPATASFAVFSSLDAFTGQVLAADTQFTSGGTSEVDGVPATELVSAAGSVWVANDGAPYPVKIEPKTGEGSLQFTDWNAEVDIQPPAESETVVMQDVAGETGGPSQ